MKKLILICLLVNIPVIVAPAYGQWIQHIVDSNLDSPTDLTAGDIDGDSDLDIVANIAYDNDLVWYENDNLTWEKYTIDGELDRGVGVIISDIDSDDILDVVATGWGADAVKWYKNEGGSPITWAPYTIDNNIDGPEFVAVADIDNDLDPDVVATGYNANNVVWYENGGGTPISWTKHTIDGNLTKGNVCLIADIDGDDTLDVIATGLEADDVVWYKNQNAGQNWTKYWIDNNLDGAMGIAIDDIDDDSDPDVVAAGRYANNVVWYENNGGAPVIWTKHTIDADLGEAFDVDIAYIDSDSTLDIFATGFSAGDVVWYSNDGETPINWTKHPIDADFENAWVLTAADIDGDKSMDVLLNQHFRGIASGSIVWYENPLGTGIEWLSDLTPHSYVLNQNYPNPFNPTTTIKYTISKQSNVTLKVFDVRGREMATLVNGQQPKGNYEIEFDATELTSGVYFYQLRSGNFSATRKMLLMQ